MDKALVKKYFFRFLKEKEVFTEYKKYLGRWETSKSGADGWSLLEREWYDILMSLKISI